MPVGTKIQIDAQVEGSPMISVSTCNMTLHMSGIMKYDNSDEENWDDTKEKFIANLKVAINTEGFQNG